MDVITRDLGSDFKIMRIWFKMYPCVATVQGVIDTLASLIEKHKIRAGDVEEIKVGISETSLSHGGAIMKSTNKAAAWGWGGCDDITKAETDLTGINGSGKI
jgi:2-methylcitrate dehydratase PrpD